MSSLCVQAATPRQPASGSVLSWTALCRHVIVCDPGKLIGCTYPVTSPTTLAFDQDPQSRRFPQPPPSDSHGDVWFRGFTTVHFRYDLPTRSPPCRSWPKDSLQPTETFTSGLPAAWSLAPLPDITTVATEQFHRLDFLQLEQPLASLHGSSRRYLCESFLGCLVPYHGGPTGCLYLFLPPCRRPSPREVWVGFPLLSANTTSRGGCFRGCRHFFMFRPPSLLVAG